MSNHSNKPDYSQSRTKGAHSPDLLSRLQNAWSRDAHLPLSARFDKARRYALALASAPLHLRAATALGQGVRTQEAPVIENQGSLYIGDRVNLISRFNPLRLRTRPGGTLRIDADVTINFGTEISATKDIHIGAGSSLGPYCRLDDQAGTGVAPIRLGKDVWLATRVTVKPGVTIGDGTIVMSGSVVENDLPAGVTAGGIPARILSRQAGTESSSAPTPQATPKATPGKPLNGLLLSDFSLQELAPTFARYDAMGPPVELEMAPYGQVTPTLLGLADGQTEAGDFAWIWTRPEAVSATYTEALRQKPFKLDDALAEVDAFAEHLLAAAGKVPSVFVTSFMRTSERRGTGMLDMRPGHAGHLLHAMNARLMDKLASKRNIYLLDGTRWLLAAGTHATSDKTWYLAKVPFVQAVFDEAVADVRAALRGIKGMTKKLVILDLDDTMWGGIVGDDGWEKLRLGGHDAIGEAFVDFQREIKALTERGIILAIVSKNEESVALEAIDKHPEMVLRRDDFAAWRINWRDKAQNVAEIVQELNLGLQSTVFVDDNPIERARVREALPEVLVPDWPEDKTQYVAALSALRAFDLPSISQEDRERTQQYAQERKREAVKAQVSNFDDWLKALEVKVSFAPLSASNVARTTQLMNKTNQLNLSTRRLTETELNAWAAQPGNEVFAVTVSDKYGDAGLTGILSLHRENGVCHIVDYVLSCRVMGRRVEETLVWAATTRAAELGCTRVEAKFLPTAKNKPCFSFWQKSGFVHDTESNVFSWDLSTTFAAPVGVTAVGVGGER